MYVAGTLASAGAALLTALGAVSCVGSDPEAVGGGTDDAGTNVPVDAGSSNEAGDAACALLIGSDFDDGWTLTGATVDGSFAVILTTPAPSQKGLAWHALDLPSMQSFRATFTLKVTTANVPPADGVAFFWSGTAAPVPGDDGDLLGFCGRSDGGTSDGGLRGSAVEMFTSIHEDDAGTRHSTVGVKDNVVGTCRDEGDAVTTPALASPDAGVVLESHFEVIMNAPAASITIRREGQVVIDARKLDRVPYPIRSVGFTGATGNDFTTQVVSDFELTMCP